MRHAPATAAVLAAIATSAYAGTVTQKMDKCLADDGKDVKPCLIQGTIIKTCKGTYSEVNGVESVGDCILPDDKRFIEGGAAALHQIVDNCKSGCEFRAEITMHDKVLRVVGNVRRVSR